MLKYPFPRERHRANDAKRARLECPGSAVSPCRAAVEGEGELLLTALPWASAPGWQWDTGTESLLDSSVNRRSEIVLGKIPLALFFTFTMCPLTKRNTVCIIMKFLKRFPPHRRRPIQSEQSLNWCFKKARKAISVNSEREGSCISFLKLYTLLYCSDFKFSSLHAQFQGNIPPARVSFSFLPVSQLHRDTSTRSLLVNEESK